MEQQDTITTDICNKRVHHSLDVIVANDSNVKDNTAPQYESIQRKGKVSLSESKLR